MRQGLRVKQTSGETAQHGGQQALMSVGQVGPHAGVCVEHQQSTTRMRGCVRSHKLYAPVSVYA